MFRPSPNTPWSKVSSSNPVMPPAPSTKTLLVVYHSMTGGTLQMAQATCDGAAREAGVTARLLHARNAGPADLLAADGVVFATPENLAAISGQL